MRNETPAARAARELQKRRGGPRVRVLHDVFEPDRRDGVMHARYLHTVERTYPGGEETTYVEDPVTGRAPGARGTHEGSRQ